MSACVGIAAFGLDNQGYFSEKGSAKQGEKMRFNLPAARLPGALPQKDAFGDLPRGLIQFIFMINGQVDQFIIRTRSIKIQTLIIDKYLRDLFRSNPRGNRQFSQ